MRFFTGVEFCLDLNKSSTVETCSLNFSDSAGHKTVSGFGAKTNDSAAKKELLKKIGAKIANGERPIFDTSQVGALRKNDSNELALADIDYIHKFCVWLDEKEFVQKTTLEDFRGIVPFEIRPSIPDEFLRAFFLKSNQRFQQSARMARTTPTTPSSSTAAALTPVATPTTSAPAPVAAPSTTTAAAGASTAAASTTTASQAASPAAVAPATPTPPPPTTPAPTSSTTAPRAAAGAPAASQAAAAPTPALTSTTTPTPTPTPTTAASAAAVPASQAAAPTTPTTPATAATTPTSPAPADLQSASATGTRESPNLFDSLAEDKKKEVIVKAAERMNTVVELLRDREIPFPNTNATDKVTHPSCRRRPATRCELLYNCSKAYAATIRRRWPTRK